MQQQRQRPRGFSLTPTSTMLGVFGFFIAVYLADVISRGWLGEKMVLFPSLALHEPWRVLTTSLIHLKVSYLLQTMLGLWFFGVPVESVIGPRRTLAVMFGGATLAAFVVALVGQLAWGGMPYLGYDGVSMALLGAFGVVYASVPLSFFGVMEIRSTTLAGIFIAIRLIADLEQQQWLAAIGGFSAALSGAALSGYVGKLGPILRGYRDKLRTAKKRRGFVVIDGGRGQGPGQGQGQGGQKTNEPRFWN
jgi:membrane associated rhomboid family serine protease